MSKLLSVGIDEVGRGPLAGPVAVGAVVLKKPMALSQVRDSKQLSPKQRDEWFDWVHAQKKAGVLDFAVSFVSPRMIDKIGIVPSIQRALNVSLRQLMIAPERAEVFLDGGLQAPLEWQNQKTIIKGDTQEVSIALASIVAKVLRDRRMIQYAHKYPEYGFEKHKGYGTKPHYTALKKHGVCPLHRLTFLNK
jgi:ribonuclease HII